MFRSVIERRYRIVFVRVGPTKEEEKWIDDTFLYDVKSTYRTRDSF